MSCKTSTSDHPNYFNQEMLGLTPQIFAPGIISLQDENEFGSVFSQDGTEFFYGVDMDGKAEIRYCRFDGQAWSNPQVLLSDSVYSYNDPMLSPSGKELYFISDRASDGVGDKKDYDIYFIQRQAGSWAKAIPISHQINSAQQEYYISFTASGSLYFASNVAADSARAYDFDIYFSEYKNGVYQQAKKLPEAINSRAYEADVFIAPDESFIIFSAARREGLGRGDLYISYKNKDDQWTDAKNMGPLVNSDKHELCPFVTQDGQYFFYTSNQDIYWVDAAILNQFR
jgi:Tol biopolymer transport system component